LESFKLKKKLYKNNIRLLILDIWLPWLQRLNVRESIFTY